MLEGGWYLDGVVGEVGVVVFGPLPHEAQAGEDHFLARPTSVVFLAVGRGDQGPK